MVHVKQAMQLPIAITEIAKALGKPMLPARIESLPVNPNRAILVWEYRGMDDAADRKVVVIDRQAGTIKRWKIANVGFDDTVKSYRGKVAFRNGGQ